MSDSEFIDVYTQYISKITSDSSKLELRRQYLQEILSQHDKTSEDFRETWEALNANPEKWVTIMEGVIAKMRNMQQQVKQKNQTSTKKLNP